MRRSFFLSVLLSAFACSNLPVAAVATTSPDAKPESPAAPPAAAAAPAGIDTSSKQAFTEAVAARLRSRGLVVTVKSELLLGIADGGNETTMNLGLNWTVCTDDVHECQGDLAKMIEMIPLLGQLPPVDPATLEAAIRTVGHVQEMTGHGQAPFGLDLLAPAQVVGADLEMIVLVDEAGRARPALTGDLKALGLTRDAVVARALKNVHERIGSVVDLVKPTRDGALGSLQTGEFYESSLLLDTAGWAKVARRQPGTLLVSVPAVDTLLYKWATDPKDIEAFRAITGAFASKAQSPLSKSILRWNGTGWEAQP